MPMFDRIHHDPEITLRLREVAQLEAKKRSLSDPDEIRKVEERIKEILRGG